METLLSPAVEVPASPPLEKILEDLAERGWSRSEGFLPLGVIRALAEEAREGFEEGDFHRAGIGQGENLQLRGEVRRDHVRWLDPRSPSTAQALYLQRIEALRELLNRGLYLGLRDFEAHLAVYPEGAFYRRHLDRFRGGESRTVSCLLYLNEGWTVKDGGQLRIYEPDFEDLRDGEERIVDLLPEAGVFVAFLSDRIEHEVLLAHRERLSLTGWLRRDAVV